MKFKEVNFKSESLIVENVNRGLFEKDVQNYYNSLNYNAFREYVGWIKGEEDNHPLKEIVIPDNIKELFHKYSSGYPDIILEKNGTLSFVEIKLPGDSLRPNQVVFLNELALIADTKVLYCYSPELEKVSEKLNVKKLSKDSKVIVNQLERLVKVAEVKKLKPLWVVAELHKKYDKKILEKKTLSIISFTLKTDKNKILWFIKNSLEKAKAS